MSKETEAKTETMFVGQMQLPPEKSPDETEAPTLATMRFVTKILARPTQGKDGAIAVALTMTMVDSNEIKEIRTLILPRLAAQAIVEQLETAFAQTAKLIQPATTLPGGSA